jgi:hypothetical protein
MIGYKFTTEQEAIGAVALCNTTYGYPKEDTTTNWVGYEFANLNEPIFWYIIFDASLESVLGSPIELNVIYPSL